MMHGSPPAQALNKVQNILILVSIIYILKMEFITVMDVKLHYSTVTRNLKLIVDGQVLMKQLKEL